MHPLARPRLASVWRWFVIHVHPLLCDFAAISTKEGHKTIGGLDGWTWTQTPSKLQKWMEKWIWRERICRAPVRKCKGIQVRLLSHIKSCYSIEPFLFLSAIHQIYQAEKWATRCKCFWQKKTQTCFPLPRTTKAEKSSNYNQRWWGTKYMLCKEKNIKSRKVEKEDRGRRRNRNGNDDEMRHEKEMCVQQFSLLECLQQTHIP